MGKKNGNRKRKNDNKRQVELTGDTLTQAAGKPKQEKPKASIVKPPNNGLDGQVRKMLKEKAEREEMLINDFEQAKAALLEMIEREGDIGVETEAYENLKRDLQTKVKPGMSTTVEMAEQNINRIQENYVKLTEQFSKRQEAKDALKKRRQSYNAAACHIFGEVLKKFEKEHGSRLPCDVCGRSNY